MLAKAGQTAEPNWQKKFKGYPWPKGHGYLGVT